MTPDPAITQFKLDVAKFSGNYEEFLIIAKSKDGLLHWRSTDTTWAIGACERYLNASDEIDREYERRQEEESA